MKLIAKQKYANIIPGNGYTLIKEGLDFTEIKVKGSSQCVPKWVFEGKIDRKFLPREEDEYEDLVEW